MTRKIDRQKTLNLREKGHSYSQIKDKLGISKSTLSGWLCNMPLPDERIKELRDFNSVRIEKYRNTIRRKKEIRLKDVYKKVSRDIGKFSKREIFLLGLFLYWGEGTKLANYSV